MVLAQSVVALAEALAVAKAAGVDSAMLFDALSKGSADSFALRNHGLKAMVPGVYPQRAFSAEYMLKDVGYALELAAAYGLQLSGAENARALLERAIAAGFGAEYFPALAKVVGSKRARCEGSRNSGECRVTGCSRAVQLPTRRRVSALTPPSTARPRDAHAVWAMLLGEGASRRTASATASAGTGRLK